MKVLQVNCVYNTGSTGKITRDIHIELQNQGIESVVCYGRGKLVYEPNVYKTCGEFYSKVNHFITYCTGIMYGGYHVSTSNLIAIIRKEKPDVVHLQCLNSYFVNIYSLITWLKKNSIKTVLTLHAEFMYTANCGYALDCQRWKTGCGQCPRLKKETGSFFLDGTSRSWKQMKEAFDGFNENLIVTSVSPWLMERAMQSPILADKQHCVILNGIDTTIFHPYETTALKEKYSITNEKIIFHATPNFNNDPNHIKGGYYVLELAKRMVTERVKFIVAGAYDESIVPPPNMIFLGKISDQKVLAQYYSMADVTLLTSKKETFSMVCAESLCCGTPVVGFKAGGPEQISLSKYSIFVEYSNMEELRLAILNMLRSEKDLYRIANLAREMYSKKTMTIRYIKKYKE